MAAFISMATCNSCNQTSRLNGANRDFMSGFSKSHSTPGKRHTPQSANRAHTTAPKSASKDKTPWSTPRSSTPSTPSSGSSSSKSPSQAKAWVVQRLSKLLKRDDKQSSKKGTLKDFLSSL